MPSDRPSHMQQCLCTHSRLEHRLTKTEPCRVSGCDCQTFRRQEGGDRG